MERYRFNFYEFEMSAKISEYTEAKKQNKQTNLTKKNQIGAYFM